MRHDMKNARMKMQDFAQSHVTKPKLPCRLHAQALMPFCLPVLELRGDKRDLRCCCLFCLVFLLSQLVCSVQMPCCLSLFSVFVFGSSRRRAYELFCLSFYALFH